MAESKNAAGDKHSVKTQDKSPSEENIDPQLRLLSILERNSRKSNTVQVVSFAFGVLVSSVTIVQQIFSIGAFRSSGNLLILAGVLSFGFALIIISLAIQSKQDASIRLGIGRVAKEEILESDTENERENQQPSSKTPNTKAPDALERMRERLSQHVNRLRAFAFANIIIGSMIAGAGILVIFSLFSRVLDVNYSEINAIDNSHYTSFFVIIFLPRISIVILIQIFAYFFLSMYRANLREIRYFQMELNDLELIGEAVEISRGDLVLDHHKELVDKLFAMVRYRGDTFRLGLSSDEVVETFQALSQQGNIIDRIRSPFTRSLSTVKPTIISRAAQSSDSAEAGNNNESPIADVSARVRKPRTRAKTIQSANNK